MKINAWIGMSCLGILFWTGCSNDNDSIDMEKVWQEERETIWAYLDKNANGEVIKYAYTAGSLTDTIYMFDLEGGSAECGDAAWALVDYDIYSIGRLTGERSLYDSTDPARCAGENIEPSYRFGGPIIWAANRIFVDGILPTFIKEGGKGKAIIHSRLLMGNGTSRLYEMGVKEFIRGELLNYEYELMNQFEQDSLDGKTFDKKTLPLHEGEENVTAGDTVSYLYTIQKNVEAEQVIENDTVTVQFRAYLLDAYNEPLREIYVTGENEDGGEESVDWVVNDDIIAGVHRGLLNMRVGEEAYILMPSAMAWKSGDKFIGIPPYSTVAYWIKLISRQPKK